MHVDIRWVYAFRAGGTALILFYLWNQYVELSWPPRIALSTLMLSVSIGLTVFVLWINLDQPWMVMGDASGFDPRTEGGVNYPIAAIRLAGAALVVPIMEELFWRSLLMRWLDRADFLGLSPADVSIKATFLSSLLFASEHTYWFAGLLAGLAYAWLYLKTRNLWAPIIAHAVTNGVLGMWVLYTGQWAYW